MAYWGCCYEFFEGVKVDKFVASHKMVFSGESGHHEMIAAYPCLQ